MDSTIKEELKNLIDKEEDSMLLEKLKILLTEGNLNPVLKEKLSSRALRSEEDIANGNVFTEEEVKARINQLLHK